MAWSDFLSDIDWSGMIQRAVPAIIGADIGRSANQQAAQQIAQSQLQAAQQNADANERAAQIVAAANREAAQQIVNANAQAGQLETQGVASAQGRLQPLISGTAPAVDYLSRVMADTSLTPEQQQRIADTRRETANLLASRLGGRSATAIATQGAQNLENAIYTANRNRADQAASSMFGTNVGAVTNAANLDVGLANQLGTGARNVGTNIANLATGTGAKTAELTSDTGRVLSGATQTGGLAGAQAGLATGQLQGQAVGEILSPRNDTQSLLDAIRSYTSEQRKSKYPTGLNVPRG